MSSKVLMEICVERAEQDRKWGGPAHDDGHDDEDWLGFIDQKTSEAYKVRGRRPYDAGEQAELRRVLVQIAALAVAAVESFDRRHPPESVDPNAGKTVMLPENTFLTPGGKPPPGWPEEERKAVYMGPQPDASPVVVVRDNETRMATAPQAGDGAEVV